MSASAPSASFERSLANLKPWRPGASGNPAGRPKALVDIAALAREHGPECIAKCLALMRKSKDERVQFAAAKELLDRGYGKPLQSLASADPAVTLTFLHLVAARGFSEQMQAGNVPVVEGAAEPVADETRKPPADLMEPARE